MQSSVEPPASAEPVVGQLAEVWASIAGLGHQLSDADWDTPTDLPGWTVKDCLSHMAGTESMLAGEPPPDVDVSHLDHVRNDFGAMVERPVEARRGVPGPDVLAEFERLTAHRLDQLARMDAGDWDRLGWSPVGEAPYRTFMEVRVFDCWMHEQDMRRAVGTPGGMHSGAAVSLDRLGQSLGVVVGKRAAAPEGSTVVIDVSGPHEATFALGVTGRARPLDEVPADPTVRIAIDLETFAALGGGRWTAAAALEGGRVELSGDLDLARRILDNLATTP
jgi:uncharacterized protein (TIGR03083 family)